MVAVELSQKAYIKLLLHAIKYQSAAVNGVLLGTAGTAGVSVVDAVPLFHQQLALAPMLEIAMGQVDAHASEQGLVVVGYYHANERCEDADLGATARRIADRIQSFVPSACALLVDASKVAGAAGGSPELAVIPFEKEGAKWKAAAAGSCALKDGGALRLAADYLKEGRQRRLIDFDDHLDDIVNDWRNETLFS